MGQLCQRSIGELTNKSLLSEIVRKLCDCGGNTINIFDKHSVIHFEEVLILTQLYLLYNLLYQPYLCFQTNIQLNMALRRSQ